MTISSNTTPTECPVCGSEDVDSELGLADGLCRECGYVIETETNTEEPSEVIRSPVSQEPERPQEWRETVDVRDSSDENLVQFIDRTDAISKDLLVTDEVRLRAAEFVTEAWAEGITHGRSVDLVAAASVDLACRLAGKTRPYAAVAEAVSVSPTNLRSTRNALADELKIDKGPPDPQDYISYIRKLVGGTKSEEVAAQQRLADIDELPPGNPAGTAAAAFYLEMNSTKDTISFRESADAVGLTKETVWARAEDLRRLEAR